MSEKLLKLSDLAQVHGKLSSNEIILDVRSPEEYAEGHIEGSLNIPHDQVADHADDLEKYDKVYIHCKMGGRAKKAFEMLEGIGLDNVYCISDAGIKAWIEQGHPVVKGD